MTMRKLVASVVVVLIALASVAFAQGNTKLDVLYGGDPALAKMTSDLIQMRKAVIEGKSLQAAVSKNAPQALRNGKLQCIIGAKAITDDLLKACASAKLEVIGTYTSTGLNQIVVRCSDPKQLDAIAKRSDVRGIAPEPLAKTSAGIATSQADISINADDARTNYSVNGSGIRVGVMSDSIFDTRGGTPPGVYPGNHIGSLDQASGDLPANVWVVDKGPGGNTDEGNGMAQLIYDLAPGCSISFASAFTSYAAFAANITALRTDVTNPANIIVDDVYYFVEPMYQNGPIAIAANNAYAAGVPYFSSAGNFADQGHERNYVDIVPLADDQLWWPSGDDLHDFGVASGMASDAYLTLSLPSGGYVIATLHWDEPYGGLYGAGPGSQADLDLFLVNAAAIPNPGNTVAYSANTQGVVGSPAGEAWEFINTSVGPGTYHLVIDNYWIAGRSDTSVPPLLLSLIVEVGGSGAIVVDSAYLGDRTVYGHNAAENAMATAAMFYAEINANGGLVGGPELNVESFSSLGGNLPFYFPDGGAPRNLLAQTRFKPEITGPDGTDTTFFGSGDYEGSGYPNFFGTSAAAPHVAAVAALMLDYNPLLTPAQVYINMRSTTRDAETAGPDFLSGDGLIDANNAVMLTPIAEWILY